MEQPDSNKDEKIQDILDDEYGDGDSNDEMIDPYKLYSEAYQLMSVGEYLNSFPKFEQAFDLARNLNQMKLFDKAIADFTRDLDGGTLSKPSYCHCFRAMAYSNLNDYDNSQKDLNFAIEKEEESVIKGGYHFHRGLIRNKMKNLEGAVDDFTQAMLLDPEGSSNAIVFRFLVNYKLGNEDAMKKDYFLIKDMGNVPEQFRDDIERIGERFKFNEEEEEEPKEPKESDEEKKLSNNEASESSEESDGDQEILTTSQQTSTDRTISTAIDTPTPEPAVPALNLMGGDGDQIEISPEVEAEVNAMSNSEKLRVLKVELNKFENMTKERDEEKIMLYLASDMGRLTKLLDWFNREAKNWKTKFEDGRKLVNGKNYSGAVELLTECLEFEPQHTETYYLRAVSHYHLNELEKAMADVVEAIKQDSTNHLFFSLMGYIYVSMGDLERALRVFHQAMERKPNHHEYYYICAMLHDNLKNLDNSLEYIDKALELLPNNEPYMQFKLSVLMKKQAEVAEAAGIEQRKNDAMRQEIEEKTKLKTMEEKKKEALLVGSRREQQNREEMLPPRVGGGGDDDDDDEEEEFDLDAFRKGVEENLEDFDFRKMERLKWEMEKELEKKKRLEKELREKEDLLKQIQVQKHHIQQKVEEDEVEERRLEDLEQKEVEALKMKMMLKKKKTTPSKRVKEEYDEDEEEQEQEESDDEEEEEEEDDDDDDDEEEDEEEEEDHVYVSADTEFDNLIRRAKTKKRMMMMNEKKKKKKEANESKTMKMKEENALTTILREGDRQIFNILKAVRLGQFFQSFREKNIIWFDVVHGYLNEEDYAEVFPRVRFMRRFKTYVEKYVLKEKKKKVQKKEDVYFDEDDEDEYY